MSVYSFPCFSVFSTYSSSCHVNISLFFSFSSFIALFQVLQCAFLIFHPFQFFSPYSRSYSLYLILHILQFFGIFQVLQCSFLIFQVFQCFSPYFMSNNLCFSFSMIFSFLAIVQVLQCAFPFSTFLSVSRHIPGQTVFVSHFPRFSVFSPYSRSNSVFVSFFTFFSFLAIFHVLECEFLIFHVFQFSRHNPGSIVCISHFSRFSVFLAIF